MEKRHRYPMFLDLTGRRCVVVGGGRVGARKARTLAAAGARVTVVAPEFDESLEQLAQLREVTLEHRGFEHGDVEEAFLVFGATDSESVNAEVARAAESVGALYNDAIEPDRCDFIVPSEVRRDGLSIAISTGGASPAYSRLLREKLEGVIGPEHGQMVDLLRDLRHRVGRAFPHDEKRRRQVWDTIVSWETLDLIREGRLNEVEERVNACLSS